MKFRILPFISSSWSSDIILNTLLDSAYSGKIFVFGYSFEPSPISHALGRAGSVTTVGLSINRCSYSELTSLTRENKNDQSRSSGFGDCKGSMRFTQSIVFFSSPHQGFKRRLLSQGAYITNSKSKQLPFSLIDQWQERHSLVSQRFWVRIPFKPEFFAGLIMHVQSCWLDYFRCSVAHHGKFALERTIITRVSYTLATRNFRNLLANVVKPTICRSCYRLCRGRLRSLLSEQTVNIHKMYLLWRVGFRHQRWDYQQLIVESSAK